MLRNIRAINASLGPNGRPVLYTPSPGVVALAGDGLAIAMEMAESKGVWSVGPRILKETLFAAQSDLGDGSARLACILGGILREGAKLIAAGHPPQRLADGILCVGRLVEQRLQDNSVPAPDLAAMASGLTADSRIADAVTAAVLQSGADGVVDVREDPRDGARVESGDGFILDAALPSPYLGPEPPATTLELNNVSVLVANEIIADFGHIWPILEGFAEKKKSLAIVARDVSGSALDALVLNHRRIGLHVAAFKPTDVSARAAGVLEDLAIATGATLIDANLGRTLAAIRPTMLGKAKRLQFARGRALFAGAAGDRQAIHERRSLLAAEAEKARYLAYDREHLQRRSARLASRWSQISVGGHNSFETSLRLRETKALVAILQAALQSGVVGGGGSVLAREAWRLGAEASPEDHSARQCVARGLNEVFIHIARNGGQDANVPLAGIRESKSKEFGLDVRTGLYGDMTELGIADPLSITSGIIARAISVAAAILRVDAVISR